VHPEGCRSCPSLNRTKQKGRKGTGSNKNHSLQQITLLLILLIVGLEGWTFRELELANDSYKLMERLVNIHAKFRTALNVWNLELS
jgi:hypothetical protein